MAYDDIQVYSSPHGGHEWALRYPMEASETFGKGEVVGMDTDGQITELADEPIPNDILGIALAGPKGPGGSTLSNPRTNAAYADGDPIPVIIPMHSTLFITNNVTADGTAFDDTVMAVTDIGQLVSLALVGTTWGIDIGPAAGSEIGRLTDVLNVRKESIMDTGETLTLKTAGGFYWAVFTIQAHQHTSTDVILVQA